MATYEMVNVDAKPYIYIEKTCGMDPNEIGPEMGQAFGGVMQFMQANGVTSGKEVLAAYYTYDPNTMTFRAGMSVSEADAAKAKGEVQSDVLPAGEVLHFTHKGPYDTLRNSYADMMQYLEANNLQHSVPTWEVYVNDPATTKPEDLITEVYVSLA